MGVIDREMDRIWDKARTDAKFRESLYRDAVGTLKKEGIKNVPADLKISFKDGKPMFSTADKLVLEELNSRVTKEK